ncbi:MAG TPA: hypothetical protein VKQ89_07700 [Candidatus Angelobacter sp.]|nr:hypothetical protein [Candidatus Angelobacter sp.]
MNRIAIFLTGAILLAGSALAQENAPREKARTFTFTQAEPLSVYSPNLDMMMFQRERIPAQVEFFSSELAAGGEVITGAPYTATAVTESTQTLADGNRIVNKSSGFVARDSQGRTRREMTLHRIGPLDVNGPKPTFFINDPVTHTQYVVTGNEATKIVKSEGTWNQGLPIFTTRRIERNGVVSEKTVVNGQVSGEKVAAGHWEEGSRQVKHEDLGTQTIEGVSAQGRRETVTIPAGQIGNERPLELVTEIWTSPELHTVIMRRHSDPRMGESVFRLTDIKLGEPDSSLFLPPPGTKIKSQQTIELKREPGQPKD